MTQSPGNSSAQILTFGPIPMTHPAKTPPDALLPQIYCIISPLTETGEEAECLNFSFRSWCASDALWSRADHYVSG